MKSRIINPPTKKNYFLFGPRGVGKTTWLKSRYPGSPYVDLLEDEVYNELLGHPDNLVKFIPRASTGPIVIDEIQKIPALLNVVHRLIEESKRQFVMTGSSSRKLKKQGVNLLAGRALVLNMFPLTVRELGDDFDLVRALDFGTLPSLLGEESPRKYLEAYTRTYIREEVNQERLVRNIAGFSRFLEAATFSHARPLVMSNVARDCAVERKVVEDYFSILEDLLIGYRLPVFSRKARRDLLTKQKFFFFDPGVYQALRPRGPLDAPAEVRGPSLEGLVANELRALNHYLEWGLELFHWQTRKKEEVDLVLYGERCFAAIEIKSSAAFRIEYLAGLKLFSEDYPQARCLLLYGGEREYNYENCLIVPVAKFLRNPEHYLF